MSDEGKPVGLMLRLPADLHAAVVRFAKGTARRPATSLNGAIVFLLRAGLTAFEKMERTEDTEPGNSATVRRAA